MLIGPFGHRELLSSGVLEVGRRAAKSCRFAGNFSNATGELRFGRRRAIPAMIGDVVQQSGPIASSAAKGFRRRHDRAGGVKRRGHGLVCIGQSRRAQRCRPIGSK
jgi:hypothetical protein